MPLGGPLRGRCMCGDIRYHIDQTPTSMGLCHCKHCQRQAGSAFSTMITVPTEAFSIERGQTTTYLGPTESGNSTEIHFCGRCGSPIFSTLTNQPDLILIKAGTLDDTSWFEPQYHVWSDHKQNWVELKDNAQQDEFNGLSSNPQGAIQ
ncbi:MAG: hypothetical protein ACI9UU_000994 [Candidatus Azotimanducaceae bacterium]|jgi:hypothetical protein